MTRMPNNSPTTSPPSSSNNSNIPGQLRVCIIREMRAESSRAVNILFVADIFAQPGRRVAAARNSRTR